MQEDLKQMKKDEYKEKYWGIKNPNKHSDLKEHPVLTNLITDKKVVRLSIHKRFDHEYSEGGRRGSFWEAFDEQTSNKQIDMNESRFDTNYTYRGIINKN